MEVKNEKLPDLIQKLSDTLSPAGSGEIDIDRCRSLLDMISSKTLEVESRLALADQLLDDFRNSIVSRARAVDSARKEKGMTALVVDSMRNAGEDFGMLANLRDHVNREFNKTFQSGPAAAPDLQGHNRDLRDYKC